MNLYLWSTFLTVRKVLKVGKPLDEVIVCVVMKSVLRMSKLSLLGLLFYQFHNVACTSCCIICIYSASFKNTIIELIFSLRC